MLVPRGLFLQQAYHFTPEYTPVLQRQRIWCDNINYHLISDGLYKFHLEGLEGTFLEEDGRGLVLRTALC